MLEAPPAIVDLGPSSGWSLPAPDISEPWRLGRVRDCPLSREGQIIVCGRRGGPGFEIGPLGPDPRPLMDEITRSLTFPVARGVTFRPAEIVGARSTGVGVGFSLKF